jgi:hypothetical protein
MDFARIRRDVCPISLSEWNEVIASHAFLEQMPDRTGTNPFTKEKVLSSGKGKAYYVVDSERVGNASLEDGEILTTGIPPDVCEQIAQCLHANVFEDDRS